MAKPTTYQQKQVLASVKKWQKRLILEHYAITVLFEKSDDAEDPQTLAEIFVSNRYKRASIYIYPKFFKQTKEEREDTIVHELSHILTAPLCAIANKLHGGEAVYENEYRDANESSTEAVSRALLRVWGGC